MTTPTPETEQQKRDRLEKTARDQGLAPGALLPDYTKTCLVCGGKPVVPVSGMCGPCTFGEADTLNGNW